MHPRNTHRSLVPVAIAVVVAVIGTALFAVELRTKDVVADNATAYPTARDIGSDQISYVP
jgi:hypothetical protein